jgi:ATP-dependent Clp protease protease subunit
MVNVRLDDPRRWGMPPEQPRYPRSPAVPSEPSNLSPWLEERLFDQRIVVFNGPLTTPSVTRTAAALLTLDALGTDPIRLHMSTSDGSTSDGDLGAAFALVDALDAMRAPVHVLVTAHVGGAGIAVLAAAQRRLAYRHAVIRIGEPPAAPAFGTADEVAAAAGQYLRQLEELAERLAAVVGQPRSRVEDDLSAGRMLSATEARDYGIIDEIVGATG